jgi:hypothetical protein
MGVLTVQLAMDLEFITSLIISRVTEMNCRSRARQIKIPITSREQHEVKEHSLTWQAYQIYRGAMDDRLINIIDVID